MVNDFQDSSQQILHHSSILRLKPPWPTFLACAQPLRRERTSPPTEVVEEPSNSLEKWMSLNLGVDIVIHIFYRICISVKYG